METEVNTNQAQDMQAFFYKMGEVAYCWNLHTDEITWLNTDCEGFSINPEINNADSFYSFFNPQDIPKRKALFQNCTDGIQGKKYVSKYRFKAKNGNFIDIHETAAITITDNEEHLLYGKLQKDIVEATYEKDKLTGMHSRQWFVDSVQAKIEKDLKNNGNVEGHLLAIGIDKLSMYNEAFDAHVTDEILENVAKRLQDLLNEYGLAARISGDIFGLSIFDNNGEEIASIVSQLLASFRSAPIQTTEGNIFITLSVGGLPYSGSNENAIDHAKILIVRAESALQDAKHGGRGRYMTYVTNKTQKEQYRTWIKTSDQLLSALGGNRLVLGFQPVISAETGEIKFYECLARMADAKGKFIPAGEFMPIIEKMGTVHIVDKYIAEMAIEELKVFPDLTLSINISAWTMDDPDWLDYMHEELAENPSIANRVIVEITETIALKDISYAKDFIKKLHDLGARVALDDFGSGHSSFKQIKELAVDIVKIDRSFVHKICETEDNRLFIQMLQKLADGCDVETVGEGAETLDEAKMLQKDGVTYIQGYVYGFPSVERLWLNCDHDERMPKKVRTLQERDELAFLSVG